MDESNYRMLDLFFKGIQLIIILISAVWAFLRFRKEGPLFPRIEFDVDCQFFGPHHNAHIASITISANNKGNIEHRFREIRLRIRGIKKSEPLKEFPLYPPMVSFPEKIMEKINIIPDGYNYFFVRPGVSQKFNYPAQIPDDIRFIIVKATFRYQISSDIHTAERVFEVK